MSVSSTAARVPIIAHAVGVPKKTGPQMRARAPNSPCWWKKAASEEIDSAEGGVRVPDHERGRRADGDEKERDERLPKPLRPHPLALVGLGEADRGRRSIHGPE